MKSIRWIGNSTVDCAAHPNPASVWPIRILANAFGPARPERDLLVSPGHAICLDLLGEVLIPASALVNGATVVQAQLDRVTYWHVEAEGGHTILLAEGQPAESYADTGNREFFERGTGSVDPDRRSLTLADYCRPFHSDGLLVDAARSQLQVRAQALGWKLDRTPLGGLHLNVDGVRVEPVVTGLSARFVVPATARDIWLVSNAGVPSQVSASTDARLLGVCLTDITINDGLQPGRTIALDHPLLCLGFHGVEGRPGHGTVWCWTAGRAKLPRVLFESCRGSFFLDIEEDAAAATVGRWVSPQSNPAAAPAAKPRVIATPGLHLALVSAA